ncbi:MAG TPA: M1 family aminopeptidase, partial [Candidatus Acidoferrales bacterium]|nr:M1 family aminopeptidase [Candidatus Acidoferrales bacterium]
CKTTFSAVGKPLAMLEMDADHLRIKAVRNAAGKSLRFGLAGGRLTIELDRILAAGKSSTIVIDYEAQQPTQGIYFISPDKGYPKKPVQVWTQGQDQDAHYWFPCIDYPNAKATTEIKATVPAKFFVLSNGTLVSTTEDRKAKTKTYHWKMDTPHVTYLVSCVAGEFSEHTDMLGDLPVSYYVVPGREADGARSFGTTPKMVKFFADRIGVAYPYSKYAQVAVTDFIFGGMENTSATTQTDTTLHDARAHLDFSSEGLVAHELAHQWFGDLLTCKDWSHAWLNEGFATYFEALFREFEHGRDEFDYYRFLLAQRYFEEDRREYRRPIVTNVYTEPIDLFDRHLYEKGASVLHLIRRQLGDELWWKTIHHYVTEHQLQNVETIDLIRAIETVTGRNMLPFFDQWVFSGGHPNFRVHYRWDEEQKAALVRIEQMQDAADGTPVFTLPVTLAFGHGKTEQRFKAELEQREQTFTFALAKRPDTFSFDPDGDILKTVELRVPREMLMRQTLLDANLPARIDAIRALAKDPTGDVVETLDRVLSGRAFWGVKAQAAAALGAIRTERAFAALVKARKVDHPKARRAVALALGEFRGDEACDALAPMLARDASYFVESEAAHSIGKTKSKKAHALLIKALGKNSFHEVIRAGAMRGFAELGDDKATALVLEWTEYGKPTFAREAAVTALGKLGQGNRKVRARLIELLDDPNFWARLAAIDALEELHDPAAVPALERLAAQDVEGRLKGAAANAVRAIAEYQEKPLEFRQLRGEIEKLREDNKNLLDRLDRLETQSKSVAKR